MGIAVDSIVSMGSIISGGRVSRSILSFDVRVNSYTEIESSILFSHVQIGRHSHIRRAIIDRHISIPEGTRIGYDIEEDRKKYHVSESGIVVVVPEQRMFEEPE
jgi:glucose-1-phosphate adenylyltransferase